MNDVFISYSRRDKVFVQKVYEALTAANRSVWADWDSIPAASDWFAEIKQGIQETDSVLFVLSPEWIKSNECRKELVYAVEMGKRLFPILYLPVDPKDVPPELAKINWVYMRDGDDFDKGFQTLCSAMDTDLDWIKTHTRIQVRALEWEKKNRSASFALRGEDLTEGEQFIAGAANKSPVPTPLQSEYILASRKDATRRQRQTLVGVTVALLVSIVLGIAAFFQRQEAVAQRATAQANLVVAQTARVDANNNASTAVANEIEAKRQAQIALARQLVAQAQLFANKPQIAIPMAVQSIKFDLSAEAAQILQQVSIPRQISQKRHNGPIYSVAFSPDGKFVVSEGCDNYNEFGVCILGSAHVWSAITGKEISSMTYEGDVYTVAFSPDGKYVISEGCDARDADNKCSQGSARVWEATTGKELSRVAHKGWVLSLAFSADSNYAASGGGDGIVNIWEATTGKEVISITHQSPVNSIAFNPDGNSIVSADDSNAHIWEIFTGTEIMQISTGGALIALSKDGKYLAFGTETTPDRDPRGGGGGGGGTTPIHIWEVATKREILSDHQYGSITSLTFSRDGKYLWGNGDGDAHVWDTATGKEISRITHTGDVQMGNVGLVILSPDEKYLLISDYSDNTVRVWEIATGKEVAHMPHDSSVTALAFSPDGKYVASGSGDGSVHVWVPNGEQETSKIVKGDFLALSPDKELFITDTDCAQYDSENSCVSRYRSVWEVSTGKEASRVTRGNDMGNIIFSPNSQSFLARSSCDELGVDNHCVKASAALWDARTGNEIFTLTQDTAIYSIEFSPDGRYIVSKGCDRHDNCTQSTLYVWDVSTGKEVNRKDYPGNVLFTIAPDGESIVTAVTKTFAISPVGIISVVSYGDSTAQLWEPSTGKEIFQMPHKDPIEFVAFSPNGKYVVGVGCDLKSNGSFCTQSSSIVWDAKTGAEVTHFTHKGSIEPTLRSADGNYSILTVFSADSRFIVSLECNQHDANGSCSQNSTTIWNATTGQPIAENLPIDYFFNQYNGYLVAAGTDGTLRILEIASGKEVIRINSVSGLDVAFSPDGRYIALEGSDEAGHVWDITTGKEVARMPHDGLRYHVAFSPDGKHIISWNIFFRGQAIIWAWQADDLIANACQHMPRNLTRAEWEQFIGESMPYQAVCENLPIEPEIAITPTVTP